MATIVFALITLLFLDFSGTMHVWFGWLAKIQFLPAVLAMNVIVVAVLVLLTLLLGRIYCSVICPLGVMQDIISWFNRKKNRYSYSGEKKVLRYAFLVVFIVLLVVGMGAFAGLLAPYSSYGRIAENLLRPVYLFGNNILASIAEHYDSYAFYHTDVWIKSMPTFIIAAVSFVVIAHNLQREQTKDEHNDNDDGHSTDHKAPFLQLIIFHYSFLSFFFLNVSTAMMSTSVKAMLPNERSNHDTQLKNENDSSRKKTMQNSEVHKVVK